MTDQEHSRKNNQKCFKQIQILIVERNKPEGQSTQRVTDRALRSGNKSETITPAILCLLDYILGNMIIHYSRSRVLHARQGFDDVPEIIREENLLERGIKLIYLLIGRADGGLPAGSVLRSVEKLLDFLFKKQPRVMTVIGGIVLDPMDGPDIRSNMLEINQKLASLAQNDHHWLFFNPNASISVAGETQRQFFDRDRKVNKAGCRFIAQGLVATSKAARMLQNYNILPPK